MHARIYPEMLCRAPNDVAQGSDAESCDLQRQPIPTENGRICCKKRMITPNEILVKYSDIVHKFSVKNI